MVTEPFTRRLLASCGLDDTDATALRKALRLLPSVNACAEIKGSDNGVVVLIAGLAYRGKIGVDGARAITGILLPGDVCYLGLFRQSSEQEVIAVTHCSVACIPKVPLMTLCLDRPTILQALLVSSQIDIAILREWLFGMARRGAGRRAARLFMELHFRMNASGQCVHGSYPFPITQALLADVFGLSIVHMNRVLKQLRLSGLVSFLDGIVTIPDIRALGRFAEFDDSYLRGSLRLQAVRPGDRRVSERIEKRYLN